MALNGQLTEAGDALLSSGRATVTAAVAQLEADDSSSASVGLWIVGDTETTEGADALTSTALVYYAERDNSEQRTYHIPGQRRQHDIGRTPRVISFTSSSRVNSVKAESRELQVVRQWRIYTPVTTSRVLQA